MFTQFSGQPQCFLTREQLTDELADAGFVPDDAVTFAEHNLPPANAVHAVRAPVIPKRPFAASGHDPGATLFWHDLDTGTRRFRRKIVVQAQRPPAPACWTMVWYARAPQSGWSP